MDAILALIFLGIVFALYYAKILKGAKHPNIFAWVFAFMVSLVVFNLGQTCLYYFFYIASFAINIGWIGSIFYSLVWVGLFFWSYGYTNQKWTKNLKTFLIFFVLNFLLSVIQRFYFEIILANI